ncbi:MAG: YHYH protein [Verrucomicrobiota bacterium]
MRAKPMFKPSWAGALLLLLTAPGSAFSHPGHGQGGQQVPANQNPPAANEVRITQEGAYRFITANGIPEGEVGAFPNQGNPHAIRAQQYRFRVPLKPEKSGALTPLPMQNFGVALNGVPFDPNAAEWWRNDRRSGWKKEAFWGDTYTLGIDANFAHVQPSGAYHYHGIPADLMDAKASEQMTLVGYAADGFPIYSVYGYRDPTNPDSGVKELRSSYRLKSGQRPGGDEGPGGKHTGQYTQDYEFVPGHGDLDAANGREGVTPEYPQGTYYYVITRGFPYIPRYWVGTPDPSFGRGPGGGRRAHGSGGGHPPHRPPPPHRH